MFTTNLRNSLEVRSRIGAKLFLAVMQPLTVLAAGRPSACGAVMAAKPKARGDDQFDGLRKSSQSFNHTAVSDHVRLDLYQADD
jgi:hypothetical protein